jgi:hypothetical protein
MKPRHSRVVLLHLILAGCVACTYTVLIAQTAPVAVSVIAGAPPTIQRCLEQAVREMDNVQVEAQAVVNPEVVVAWFIAGEPTEAVRIAQRLPQDQRDDAYVRLAVFRAQHHDIKGAESAVASIVAVIRRSGPYGQIAIAQAVMGNDDAARNTLRLVESPAMVDFVKMSLIAVESVRSDKDAAATVRDLKLSTEKSDALLSKIAVGKAERGDAIAFELAKAVVDAQVRAEAYIGIARVSLNRAEPDRSRQALALALSSADLVRGPVAQSRVLADTAIEKMRGGDTTGARQALERAERLIAQTPNADGPANQSACSDLTFAQIQLHLMSGNIGDAERLAAESNCAIELVVSDMVSKKQWNELEAWINSMGRADQRVTAWIGVAEALRGNASAK